MNPKLDFWIYLHQCIQGRSRRRGRVRGEIKHCKGIYIVTQYDFIPLDRHLLNMKKELQELYLLLRRYLDVVIVRHKIVYLSYLQTPSF